MSQGVNFPAHLVVVKSTQHYVPGKGYVEVEEMDMKQMIGRAGRPQFDKTATAVIMTSQKSERHWSTFASSSSRPIESTLLGQLKEHIVAESVLGSISSTAGALKWLQSTYLWQRVLKNPAHYGLSRGLGAERLQDELRTVCLRDLRALQDAGLIELSTADGAALAPTELGSVMARYYVLFETMCEFQKVTSVSGMEHLVGLIAGAKEFGDVRLRVSEKKALNELNASSAIVRYPLTSNGSSSSSKFRVKTDVEKVNLLLQSTLGGYEFKDDFGLRQDVQNVFRCAGRLARCLRQVVVILQKALCYTPLYSAIVLAKSIERRTWGVDYGGGGGHATSPAMFRQLASIGTALAVSLYADAGLRSFDDLREADPSLVERACGRKPPFGANLQLQVVSSVPQLWLEVHCVGKNGGGDGSCCDCDGSGSVFQVDVSVKCGKVENSVCYLIVGNNKNRVLLYKRINDCSSGGGDGDGSGSKYSFRVTTNSKRETVTASLVSESFVGVDAFVNGCRAVETSPYFGNSNNNSISSKWNDSNGLINCDENKNTRNDNNNNNNDDDNDNVLSFFFSDEKSIEKRVATTPVKQPSVVKGKKEDGCESLNMFFGRRNAVNKAKVRSHVSKNSTAAITASKCGSNGSTTEVSVFGDVPPVKESEKRSEEEEEESMFESKAGFDCFVSPSATKTDQEPIQKLPKTEVQELYDSMFEGLFD